MVNLTHYALATSALGGSIKMFETWDAKLNRITLDANGKKHIVKRDMLMGEKFSLCCWATAMGPFLFPLKVFAAMNRVDMYFKGERPIDQGYLPKNDFVDYLF
jgi:hypothetical protein